MPERKKILYVITKGNFGGAQRYVFDLATNLPKDKFETVVACGEGEMLPNFLKEKNLRTIQIKKLVREINFFDEFKVCKELINLIRLEKPDVIHLNSSKIGGIGAVAAKIASWFEKSCKPKIIFTAHNWGFNDIGRSFFEKVFYYASHWVTIILCHKVIAVSIKTKKDMAFLPFVEEKIEVIYNGISNFSLLPKEEARENLFGPETKKTIIFSVSELHKNKGIDTALKALSLLPQETKEKIIWYIAGSGEERENLEKFSDRLKIKNLIRFLGFVPDVKKFLHGADIFLLPSKNEAFPYVVLEAGFAKLPIIATSVGGISEIIHDMQNGILIHRNNPKEIAEAIMYLLDHSNKTKEFGREIKKTVTNFFTLGRMIEETIRVYELT